MSDNFFRNKEEEVARLLKELADLKSTMKDVAFSLARIERHVKRSFSLPGKNKSPRKKTSEAKTTSSKKVEPTIKPEEALQIFDKMSENWNDKDPATVEDNLKEMKIVDLKLMAHELGLTFKSKPSKKALCVGIMRRLNERAMLSVNVNIVSPRTGSKNE